MFKPAPTSGTPSTFGGQPAATTTPSTQSNLFGAKPAPAIGQMSTGTAPAQSGQGGAIQAGRRFAEREISFREILTILQRSGLRGGSDPALDPFKILEKYREPISGVFSHFRPRSENGEENKKALVEVQKKTFVLNEAQTVTETEAEQLISKTSQALKLDVLQTFKLVDVYYTSSRMGALDFQTGGEY